MSEIGRGWGVRFMEPREPRTPRVLLPTAEQIAQVKAADVETVLAALEGRTSMPIRLTPMEQVVVPAVVEPSPGGGYTARPAGPNSYGLFQMQPPEGGWRFETEAVPEDIPSGRGVPIERPERPPNWVSPYDNKANDPLGQYGYVSYKVAFAAPAVVSPPEQRYTVKDDGVYTMQVSPQQAYDLLVVDDPQAEREMDEEDPVWTDV